MNMVRIELPALRTLRLTNIGTRDAATWVVTGPTTDVAAAIAAGGAWVLTRRGPRVVLIDRVVTVDGVPALVPQEPTFESNANERQMDIADMSTDMLRALLAQREAQERAQAQDAPVAPVASATKRTTRKSASKSAATKSATKRTTRKSASEAQDQARAAAAPAAVADVTDEDLRALLAQAQS